MTGLSNQIIETHDSAGKRLKFTCFIRALKAVINRNA